MMRPEEWEFHPLANLFPLLEGDEFTRLCDDIKANGLLEPIWTYQGKILDGRNRYRGCEETGTEPRYREYEGDDPVGFVVSLNLHRRHLDESQRSMVAAKIANLKGPGRPAEIGSIEPISQETAADLLNVSRSSVKRAAKVQEEAAPEVVEAVEKGTVAVSAAVLLTELPEEQQKEVLTSLIEEVGGGKITSSRIEKGINVLLGKPTSAPASDTYEWYTPAEYIEAARRLMGEIDLDPASSEVAQGTVQAGRFFTRDTDGLEHGWSGRVWLNPPYSAPLVRAFIDKLRRDYEAREVTEAVLLVNNATDAQWFQELMSKFPVCFTAGRVKFWGPFDEGLGPRQGQAFIYLGERRRSFAEIFTAFGTVVFPLE
jgi:phage N-6-adenine-methyltransferase